VEGCRSRNNSNTASSEKITTAIVDPMKASGELLRFNQPRCAAHATTAGGVKERNPAVKPIPKANAKMEFIENGFNGNAEARTAEKPGEKKRGQSLLSTLRRATT